MSNKRIQMTKSTSRIFRSVRASFALCAVFGATASFAAPTFESTTNAAAWQVATNVGFPDGQFSSFPTTGFQTAVAISGRPGWIANNDTGTNGWMETWTFFNFRQTFDLSGYDASTTVLKFQWAADDSGEGFAYRGSWVPKFSLNGGALVPWGSGPTYDFGSIVTLDSGFVSGLNTIDFYVEGNGVTDGFALRTISITAQDAVTAPIPEPETYAMMLAGLGLLGFMAKRRKRQLR